VPVSHVDALTVKHLTHPSCKYLLKFIYEIFMKILK